MADIFLLITLIFYLIIFILLIACLVKAKKFNDEKYFKIYNGIILGVFITTYLYRIGFEIVLGDDLNLGFAVILNMFLYLVVFINLILLVIGVVFRKKIRNNDFYDNTSSKYTFLKSLLSVILISILTLLINYIINNNGNSAIGKNAINYLNKKYGNHDYKVVEIKKEYGYNGFIQHLDCYIVYIKSSINSSLIHVEVDPNAEVSSDNLLYTYYGNLNTVNNINEEVAKLQNYLNSYVDVELEIDSYDTPYDDIVTDIPLDYGKIPTRDELIDLINKNILSNYLIINVKENAIDNKLYSIEEAENMLKNIKFGNGFTYTIDGTTVYNDKNEIFKVYSSEEDLLNNLNKDIKLIDYRSSSVVEERLLNYYEKISNQIIDYYNNGIDWFVIKCKYKYDGGQDKVSDMYYGYIVITANKIYIGTKNGSNIRTSTESIKNYADKVVNR